MYEAINLDVMGLVVVVGVGVDNYIGMDVVGREELGIMISGN